MKYGLSDEQWDAAKDEIRQFMVNLAKLGTTITYGEMTAQLQTVTFHPGAYGFHALLRDVCFAEYEAGRGMLCAVVVSKATGKPGQGFFKALVTRRECQNNDLDACWRDELQKLYTYWQNA